MMLVTNPAIAKPLPSGLAFPEAILRHATELRTNPTIEQIIPMNHAKNKTKETIPRTIPAIPRPFADGRGSADIETGAT